MKESLLKHMWMRNILFTLNTFEAEKSNVLFGKIIFFKIIPVKKLNYQLKAQKMLFSVLLLNKILKIPILSSCVHYANKPRSNIDLNIFNTQKKSRISINHISNSNTIDI